MVHPPKDARCMKKMTKISQSLFKMFQICLLGLLDKKDLDDDPDVKEAKEEDDLTATEKPPSTPTENQVC
jgi:hypothetical protein